MDLWSKRLLIDGKGEPLYYCYVKYVTGAGNAYYYAKSPLGSDMKVYCHKSNAGKIPETSEYLKQLSGFWRTLSKTSGHWDNGTVYYTCERHYAGDLYE